MVIFDWQAILTRIEIKRHVAERRATNPPGDVTARLTTTAGSNVLVAARAPTRAAINCDLSALENAVTNLALSEIVAPNDHARAGRRARGRAQDDPRHPRSRLSPQHRFVEFQGYFHVPALQIATCGGSGRKLREVAYVDAVHQTISVWRGSPAV